MRKNWHGLMKIIEIQCIQDGKILWEDKNIYNTFHSGGELFMLTCCFENDGSLPPPYYYLGLDNRSEITEGDLIDDISDEPSGNGYLRVPVSSINGFTIDNNTGIYKASSQIVTFSATGSGYGPVSKLFLTTSIDNSGVLLASAPLSESVTFTGGLSLNMRMTLSVRDIS